MMGGGVGRWWVMVVGTVVSSDGGWWRWVVKVVVAGRRYW